VVLVGGSTRITYLREKLREFFGGKQLCQSINPDEAVAYGAAVQGAIMSHASAATWQLNHVDVAPLSLDIELAGKIFSVVIPHNPRSRSGAPRRESSAEYSSFPVPTLTLLLNRLY
jgi:L1 cell adhesion molecule like protein